MEESTPDRATSSFHTKVPRLYHKKSKNGCQRCRGRKVKCDEKRPLCGSCKRHGVSCVFDDPFRHSFQTGKSDQLSSGADYDGDYSKTSLQDALPGPVLGNLTATVPDLAEILEPVESPSRRLLELRLLHHFVTRTCQTFPASIIPLIHDVWSIRVPKMAMSHPSLLYALLSLSALHLSRTEPEDINLPTAHRTYQVLALQNHRLAINKLDDPKNADPTCLTSVLIFLSAYAALQDRDMQKPYEPPIQWLIVSNGTRNIFHTALEAIQHDPTALIHTIIKSSPLLSRLDDLYRTSNGEEFSNLLLPIRTGNIDRDLQDEAELHNEESRSAYENTVTYLGTLYIYIKRGDLVEEICRLIMSFAVIAPSKMIWLIEAKRPRAFVILAYYFALVGCRGGAFENVWWIGKIARREIEAIQKCLSEEWQELMSWPLEMTKPMTAAEE